MDLDFFWEGKFGEPFGNFCLQLGKDKHKDERMFRAIVILADSGPIIQVDLLEILYIDRVALKDLCKLI